MANVASEKNAAVLVKRALAAYNASNFDQAVEHSRAALIVLGSISEDTAQVLLDQAYERLCMSYQRIGNYAAARDIVTEWTSRTQRTEGRIRTLIHHSRVEDYLGHYDTAPAIADDAIRQAEAANLPLELGIAKRIRADMYWKRGHSEQALALGQEAIALLEQTGALDPLAGAHVTMAAAYHASGQFYKAIEELKQTARIVEQLGRQYELSIVYSNLGETYAELYAMDKALEAHQKAIDLVGMDRASADLIRNMGVDLVEVGRTEEGMQYLSIALERAQQINDPDVIAQALYSLAKYELRGENPEVAEAHGLALQAIAERLDSLRHRLRSMLILGEVARRKGDHAAAQSIFSECSMLAQQSADRNTIWRAHAVLYDLTRSTMPQMADIHRRMAAEMMNSILVGIEDPDLRDAFRNADVVQAVLGDQKDRSL